MYLLYIRDPSRSLLRAPLVGAATPLLLAHPWGGSAAAGRFAVRGLREAVWGGCRGRGPAGPGMEKGRKDVEGKGSMQGSSSSERAVWEGAAGRGSVAVGSECGASGEGKVALASVWHWWKRQNVSHVLHLSFWPVLPVSMVAEEGLPYRVTLKTHLKACL